MVEEINYFKHALSSDLKFVNAYQFSAKSCHRLFDMFELVNKLYTQIIFFEMETILSEMSDNKAMSALLRKSC